jgi:phage protein D
VHQEDQTTIVQRGTDLQFVRSLARRNGLEFYFETDRRSRAVVAFLRAPRLDGTPQDDLAIQFGDDSNLKSFTVHVHGDRPLAVKTAQVDVEAGSPTTAEAPDSQLRVLGDKDLPTLAEDVLGRLVTPRQALAQMLVLGPPTSDATELRTIAQAVRDEAAWFITATGEVNSDAYQTILRPRRTVLVKGAGSQYSGTYYVTGVTHRMSGDGSYTQSFRARRNARDVTGSEPFGGGGLAVSIPGG